MQQPTVTHFSVGMYSLLIKTGEGRRRSDAVKTMTVVKDTKFHTSKKLVILAIAR